MYLTMLILIYVILIPIIYFVYKYINTFLLKQEVWTVKDRVAGIFLCIFQPIAIFMFCMLFIAFIFLVMAIGIIEFQDKIWDKHWPKWKKNFWNKPVKW